MGAKVLRVLVACPRVENPYVGELVRSLGAHEGIEDCRSSVDGFLTGKAEADVVHIQWPEALFGWKDPKPDALRRLQDSLSSWRERGTAIVTTVHNEIPHIRRSESSSELYEIVLGESHALIHFGWASQEILRARYGEIVNACEQWTIPHGDYSVFVKRPPMHDAVAGVSTAGCRFLVFGTIRDANEVTLIRALWREVRRRGGTLSIVARLPHPGRRSLAYYRTRMPFQLGRGVNMKEMFVPDDEVQEVVDTSDVIVVPRHNTLNSGNIALAYTFGKVVLGPCIGNIGEELRASGNAIFDPRSGKSLARAVDEAIDLVGARHGALNLLRAKNLMNWRDVADQHHRLYLSAVREAGKTRSTRRMSKIPHRSGSVG